MNAQDERWAQTNVDAFHARRAARDGALLPRSTSATPQSPPLSPRRASPSAVAANAVLSKKPSPRKAIVVDSMAGSLVPHHGSRAGDRGSVRAAMILGRLVWASVVVAAMSLACERARKAPPPAPRDAGPRPLPRPTSFPSCETSYAPRPDRDPGAMCYVRGGTYEVKAAPDPLGFDTGFVPAEVEDFLIDRDEVTVAQFVRFLNEAWKVDACPYPDTLCEGGYLLHPPPVQYRGGRFVAKPGTEHLAMWGVLFEHLPAYCAWAGKRLPTLSEWWVAVLNDPERRRRQFPWGDEPDLSRMNCAEDHCRDGFELPAPPGSLGDLSAWGVRDAFGNAGEFVVSCELCRVDLTGRVHDRSGNALEPGSFIDLSWVVGDHDAGPFPIACAREPCTRASCVDGCDVYDVGSAFHRGEPRPALSKAGAWLGTASGVRCALPAVSNASIDRGE